MGERKNAVADALTDPETEWDEDADEDFDEFCEWLREPSAPEASDPDGNVIPRGADAANLLDAARDVLRARHPERVARERLTAAAPEFALFSDADRDLQSQYDLADPGIRTAPPQALGNLLWIAELDLEHLWRDIEDGNTGASRTRERRANENLRARLVVCL